MTVFKSQVTNILKNKPEFVRELVILLGVIQLCKIIDVESFETIVKTFGIKSNHWWPMINEITEDEDFEQLIEGPLYEKVLELQMWLSNHKHDVQQGSVLWYLMKNGKV